MVLCLIFFVPLLCLGEIAQFESKDVRSNVVIVKEQKPFVICETCPEKNLSVISPSYPLWIRFSKDPFAEKDKKLAVVDNKKQEKTTEIIKENKLPKTITVYFDLNSFSLSEREAKKIILKPVESIFGYTCDIGSKKYNDTLALKRAVAVSEYLKKEGVNVDKVEIKGRGKCCYVSEDKSFNRRVEIKYLEK